MESHPVPQNVTAFEFRLFGNMTVKQFGYLAIGLVVAWITFMLFAPTLPFIAYPVIVLSLALGSAYAFLPILERPLDYWTKAFIKAITKPTIRKYQENELSKDDVKFSNRLSLYLEYLEKSQQTAPQTAQQQLAQGKDDVVSSLPVTPQTELSQSPTPPIPQPAMIQTQPAPIPQPTPPVSAPMPQMPTQPIIPVSATQPVQSQPLPMPPSPVAIPPISQTTNIPQPLPMPVFNMPQKPVEEIPSEAKATAAADEPIHLGEDLTNLSPYQINDQPQQTVTMPNVQNPIPTAPQSTAQEEAVPLMQFIDDPTIPMPQIPTPIPASSPGTPITAIPTSIPVASPPQPNPMQNLPTNSVDMPIDTSFNTPNTPLQEAVAPQPQPQTLPVPSTPAKPETMTAPQVDNQDGFNPVSGLIHTLNSLASEVSSTFQPGSQTTPEAQTTHTSDQISKTVALAQEAQTIQQKILETEKKLADLKHEEVNDEIHKDRYEGQYQEKLAELQELNKRAQDISRELAILSKKPEESMQASVVKPSVIPTLTLTSIPNIINGIVTDVQGNYIESAIVVAHDKNSLPVRALKTNKLGQFIAATPLSDGIYTLTIEKEGYIFDVAQIELKGGVINPIVISAKAEGGTA